MPSSPLLSTPPTPGPNSLPSLDENPDVQGSEDTFLSNAVVAGPEEVRYTCGDGYTVDQSDTSIPLSAEVSFNYEIHNGIEVPVSEALRDVKKSILEGIADIIQCDITYSGRRLQNGFDNIIGLWSNSLDLPDPDALGCVVDVDTSNPTICTPVSGSFTFFANPGTSKISLDETTKSLLAIVQTSMDSGQFESGLVEKAIYIGERENDSKSLNLADSMSIIHTEGTSKSNKGLMIAVYVLASVCLLLLFLVCFTARACRGKTVDERTTFRPLMTQRNGGQTDPESQRRFVPHPSQPSQNRIFEEMSGEPLRQREKIYQNYGPHHRSVPIQNPNKIDAFANIRPVAASHPAAHPRYFTDRQDELNGIAVESSPWNHGVPFDGDDDESYPSLGDIPQVIPQNPSVSRRKSVDESSSSDSSTDSSEGGMTNDTEQNNIPVSPNIEDTLNTNSYPLHSFDDNRDTPAFNNSAKSFQSESSGAREERQERLARARARSATRQSRNHDLGMS